MSRNTFWIFGLRMRAAQELTAKQPGDVCSPIHPERKGVWLTSLCLDSFWTMVSQTALGTGSTKNLFFCLSVCLSIYLSLLRHINLTKWKLNYVIAMGVCLWCAVVMAPPLLLFLLGSPFYTRHHFHFRNSLSFIFIHESKSCYKEEFKCLGYLDMLFQMFPVLLVSKAPCMGQSSQ